LAILLAGYEFALQCVEVLRPQRFMHEIAWIVLLKFPGERAAFTVLGYNFLRRAIGWG
jgi:hypothetical protein